MTKHTPLVEAYAQLVAKEEGHLYIAAKNNRKRALDNEVKAQGWSDAEFVLFMIASDDEQIVMQYIYRHSKCLDLKDEMAKVRHSEPMEESR